METYTVRKSAKFCYAHSLPGHPHCDPLHGHNAIVTMEVVVERLQGPWDFVVDFGDLKKVVAQYDHSGEVLPLSAEKLARLIGLEVMGLVPRPREVKVTIEETPGSVAEWRWTSVEAS